MKSQDTNSNGEKVLTEPTPELKEKLESLPKNPGIYQFKNSYGTIIYVGKAKNLRNRVRSYFRGKKHVDAKTKAMIGKIADLELIVVDSEAEALILEDTLIKKLKPKYNVLLRDDKSYPYVRVTNEEYPRIFYTRNIIRDGSKYFGPFTEVRPLKHLMRVLRNLFYLRSCDYKLTDEAVAEKKFKLCLDYHIDKCLGPCEGLISKEEYNENIRQAMQILAGRTRDLEKMLEQEMLNYSEGMQFEEAARIRNRLEMLREYTARQKIVSTDPVDRDVFALARVDESACSIIFKIRDGKLIGKRHFIVKDAAERADGRIIQRTIERWYIESEFIPGEIFLPVEPDDPEYLLDWIGRKKGSPVNVHIPQRGEKKKLVNMAAANAEFILRDYHIALAKREQAVPHALVALQRDLRLSKPPRRIECFDNSHIQGSELVSSMVTFVDGKPKKTDYRKYKIRTVHKNDDFAAMRETIGRRYRRLLDAKSELPDLVIVDGGKGQLSSAYSIMQELDIAEKVKIIGLAKKLEEVFLPGESEAVILPKTSSSLRLLQQLRDEAHRFAITFHRQLRSKRTLRTQLTEIPGIGEKTANKLLREFGSLENIKKAGSEKLRDIVGPKIASKIESFDFS